jgi:hypothetical protein
MRDKSSVGAIMQDIRGDPRIGFQINMDYRFTNNLLAPVEVEVDEPPVRFAEFGEIRFDSGTNGDPEINEAEDYSLSNHWARVLELGREGGNERLDRRVENISGQTLDEAPDEFDGVAGNVFIWISKSVFKCQKHIRERGLGEEESDDGLDLLGISPTQVHREAGDEPMVPFDAETR